MTTEPVPERETSFLSPVSASTILDEDCVLEALAPHLLGFEDVEVERPAVGLLVHLPRVLLEYHPLTVPKGSDVDHVVVLLRHFPQEVVLVALGFEVDVALRTLQRPEILR